MVGAVIAIIEVIPDEDTVFRLVDFPFMYKETKELIWENIFQFPGGSGESLVWSKYATTPSAAHGIGCERQRIKQINKPTFKYIGYIQAIASTIRAVQTKNGHGFKLIHAPSEGIHHAEIHYAPANDAEATSLNKSEKAELRYALRKAFGDLNPHECAF